MRGEFVDLDGVRLYYYAAGSRGSGEPVVFLHGFATSGHLWSDVVSLMPQGHRLVVVDLLGFGRSDPPAGRALTLRGHAARIVALLDALSIRQACIVGHGVGGGVAQAMAVEWPERVSRIALVNSVASSGWLTRNALIAHALLPLLRLLPSPWLVSLVRTELERGYRDPARAAHSLDRYTRPFTGDHGREALVQHVAALDAGETAAVASRLAGVRCPAAIIWGADDPFFGMACARRLASALPMSRLTEVADARHFTPEDAPRAVADAIAELLAR